MSEHTPGPWEVGQPGNGEPGYIYCDDSAGSAVAIAYGKPLMLTLIPRDQAEANARLIAAAPELLEALRTLVRATATTPGTHGLAIDNARAAIAKATGAQP